MTRARPPFARLSGKVDFNAPSGCWEFIGAKNSDGYGFLTQGVPDTGKRTTVYAHRLMFEMVVGPIPDGLQIDHVCRNTSCCNPEHLEPVTPAENSRRSDSVSGRCARATHCIRGHEFTPENTYVTPKGERSCRTCKTAARVAFQDARRAAKAAGAWASERSA